MIAPSLLNNHSLPHFIDTIMNPDQDLGDITPPCVCGTMIEPKIRIPGSNSDNS